MHPSVEVAWPAVCRAHEGVTTWMYLDTKGKVTTGVGFFIDSPAAALPFFWLTRSGQPATADQITAEWRRVKALTKWQHRNGLDAVWRDSATLTLAVAEVDRKLDAMTPTYWRGVVRSAPNVDTAPADAQLALIDLAWQNGPAFLDGWPDTRAAVRSGDWSQVADLLTSFLPKGARTTWRVGQFRAAAVIPSEVPSSGPPAPAPAPAPVEVPPVAVKWQHTDSFGGQRFRSWRGGYMTPTGIAVCEAVPSPVYLSQGGLSHAVPASGQTHNGLGAYDVKVKGWTRAKIFALCAELIRSGECAFPRGGLFGSAFFVQHVHVASANNYSSLHPTAQAQVRDFKHKPRRNGLVGHGAYVGPSTPLGSWDGSPYNPKNVKTPDALQYAVAVDELQGLDVDRQPRSGKNRKRGFVIDAHALVRRWGRWNVVTTIGTYYAVSDSKRTYLTPVIPPVPDPIPPVPPVVSQEKS